MTFTLGLIVGWLIGFLYGLYEQYREMTGCQEKWRTVMRMRKSHDN